MMVCMRISEFMYIIELGGGSRDLFRLFVGELATFRFLFLGWLYSPAKSLLILLPGG